MSDDLVKLDNYFLLRNDQVGKGGRMHGKLPSHLIKIQCYYRSAGNVLELTRVSVC